MTPESASLLPLPTIGSHLIVAPTQPHPTPVPIRHTLESPSPPRAIDGCRAVTRPARGKRVVVREDGPRAHGVTIKRRDWAPKRIRLAAIDARLLPDCEAAQHTTAFEAEQIADAELESMQCEGSHAADEIDLFASDSEDGASPGGVVPSLTLPPSPSQTDDEEEIDVPPDNRFAGYYQYKSPLRPRADGMKWWEKPS